MRAEVMVSELKAIGALEAKEHDATLRTLQLELRHDEREYAVLQQEVIAMGAVRAERDHWKAETEFFSDQLDARDTELGRIHEALRTIELKLKDARRECARRDSNRGQAEPHASSTSAADRRVPNPNSAEKEKTQRVASQRNGADLTDQNARLEFEISELKLEVEAAQADERRQRARAEKAEKLYSEARGKLGDLEKMKAEAKAEQNAAERAKADRAAAAKERAERAARLRNEGKKSAAAKAAQQMAEEEEKRKKAAEEAAAKKQKLAAARAKGKKNEEEGRLAIGELELDMQQRVGGFLQVAKGKGSDITLDFNAFVEFVEAREVGPHDEDVLQQRFQEMDMDGSGEIDLSEYLLWGLKEALYKAKEKVSSLFAKWDRDGSGEIDAKEFRVAVASLGLSLSPTDSELLFNMFDTDGGGTINYDELHSQLAELRMREACSKRQGDVKHGKKK